MFEIDKNFLSFNIQISKNSIEQYNIKNIIKYDKI